MFPLSYTQNQSIVAAAKIILGPSNCTSLETGSLCDADTLAEALSYTHALRGYIPPNDDDDENVEELVPNFHLTFVCPSLDIGCELAECFVQTCSVDTRVF